MQLLLNNGADISQKNYENETALLIALGAGHVDTALAIISAVPANESRQLLIEEIRIKLPIEKTRVLFKKLNDFEDFEKNHDLTSRQTFLAATITGLNKQWLLDGQQLEGLADILNCSLADVEKIATAVSKKEASVYSSAVGAFFVVQSEEIDADNSEVVTAQAPAKKEGLLKQLMNKVR